MPRTPIRPPQPQKKRAYARKKFTAAEARAQRAWVEQLYVQGLDASTIARLSERDPQAGGIGYRITKSRVDTLIQRIHTVWIREGEMALGLRKERRLRRIQTQIQKATAEKKWSAVATLEKLSAEIAGDLAPQQVEVKAAVAIAQSVTAVLGEMSEDEIQALLREDAERDAKARAYDALAVAPVELAARVAAREDDAAE
jgi:hypothetical protein